MKIWPKLLLKYGKKKLSKEKIKDRLEKHNRPENVESIKITKVNPELFVSLSKNRRSTDIKYQKIQNYNNNAAIPIIRLGKNMMQKLFINYRN